VERAPFGGVEDAHQALYVRAILGHDFAVHRVAGKGITAADGRERCRVGNIIGGTPMNDCIILNDFFIASA